jgi:hypothetical protein
MMSEPGAASPVVFTFERNAEPGRSRCAGSDRQSPGCINYGVAAEQKSTPGSNRYTLESRKKGISSCLCTS